MLRFYCAVLKTYDKNGDDVDNVQRERERERESERERTTNSSNAVSFEISAIWLVA